MIKQHKYEQLFDRVLSCEQIVETNIVSDQIHLEVAALGIQLYFWQLCWCILLSEIEPLIKMENTRHLHFILVSTKKPQILFNFSKQPIIVNKEG